MIHVMNPFKMSIAMFRLTSLGLEYQAQMMKALTRLAAAPLASAPEEDTGSADETATEMTATMAKPAARRSRGATKAEKPAARRPRKPSVPPAMPEPVSKEIKAEDSDAAENVPV